MPVITLTEEVDDNALMRNVSNNIQVGAPTSGFTGRYILGGDWEDQFPMTLDEIFEEINRKKLSVAFYHWTTINMISDRNIPYTVIQHTYYLRANSDFSSGDLPRYRIVSD